jgi:hypothetical protein
VSATPGVVGRLLLPASPAVWVQAEAVLPRLVRLVTEVVGDDPFEGLALDWLSRHGRSNTRPVVTGKSRRRAESWQTHPPAQPQTGYFGWNTRRVRAP